MKNLIFVLILAFNVYGQKSSKFDHSLFDKILKDNVTENGLVNYLNIKDTPEFEVYLKKLANADLTNLSENEKLAFYINAYNAYVIKNVLNLWPIKSPLDDKGFFKKYKFNIAGEELSLDGLEYKYIFEIENILVHFGLVCAGLSCPKLIPMAYTGQNVYDQLIKNANVFLQDTNRNKLDKKNKILYVSEIFKWFGKSFEEKYGSIKNAFVELSNHESKSFIKNNEIEVKYIRYDWKLNKTQ